MEEKKLTDEELNELIKKLEYQSWAQNFFELSQAAHMLKRQKAEIETLKSELRKECEEHEEFTKKAKFIFNRFARGDCEEAEKKLKELQE
jgi:hypothetical protein